MAKVKSRSLLNLQANALRKLQTQIAKKSSVTNAKKIDVRKLSGRMSSKQLSALRYFIKVRYTDSDRYAKPETASN